MGLGLLLGLTPQDAKKFATKHSFHHAQEVDKHYTELLRQLWPLLAQHDEGHVLDFLISAHVRPTENWTVQHCLCEYRKLKVPRGRPYGVSHTHNDDYLLYWHQAAPIYAMNCEPI